MLDQLSDTLRECARRDAELEGARREIEQRQVELRGKEGQIARRDGEIEKLTRELQLKSEALAQKEVELVQKNEEVETLRKELEAEKLLAKESNQSSSSSTRASTDQSCTSQDNRKEIGRELKSLRKAHRKLTAQIAVQYKMIASLRALVEEADKRYGNLYPMEKAIVILSAVYGEKLRGQPTVSPDLRRSPALDRPPGADTRS